MKRLAILLVATLLFTYITYSYLTANTTALENHFNEEEVSCMSHINKSDSTLSSITITNTSDVGCYIRFKVITYYKEDHQIKYRIPSINIRIINTCKYIARYYYYPNIVAAHTTTSNLLKDVVAVDENEEVVVIAEVIQANNEQAVKDVWGVSTNAFIE